MSGKPTVELVEVGPRDGLQNEAEAITAESKIALIDALSRCGFKRIEAGSFVSPRRVPQMADSDAVLRGIARSPSVRYAALVPNLRGLRAALDARVDEVAVFASASEGFSTANINATVAESLERLAPLIRRSSEHGLPVRGYVSCAVACPFDGNTDPDKVTRVAAELADRGCYEISLGDTIGAGTPESVSLMLESVTRQVPGRLLAGHFHDTDGNAVANICAAIEFGLRSFDTAAGGLGGCPFAPGAPGNAATETVNGALRKLGYDTGIDEAALHSAVRLIKSMIR